MKEFLPSSEDFDFQRYMNEQVKEALGDFNRWMTGESLGKDPTDDECGEHFVRRGGAKVYAQKHKRDLEVTDPVFKLELGDLELP